MKTTKKWNARALALLLAVAACLAGCRANVPETPVATPIPPVQTVTVAETGEPAAPPTREPAPLTAGTLRVLFLNVGKADAILVQYAGYRCLIDTGTKESAPRLLGVLRRLGVDALDAVFLTHTHADHIGGMEALASAVPVKQVYGAVYSENKKDGTNKITKLCERLNLPLSRIPAGETVAMGDAAFMVLGPLSMNNDDDNDNSLVLRLAINNRVLLFTGDMQFAEEETLLRAGIDLAADVLKVGNHGNPDATSEEFAQAVSPALAVVSTDTNVDADSANPRVVASLGAATVLVTEDTPCGVLLDVLPDGTLETSALAAGQSGPSRYTVSVDVATQTATIQNHSDALTDFSGCMLFSERGGELFIFPAGAALAPGASLTVSGEGGGGDYEFSGEKSPWSKKKTDTAVLYDAFGNELDRK